jgi:hypothetical protein
MADPAADPAADPDLDQKLAERLQKITDKEDILKDNIETEAVNNLLEKLVRELEANQDKLTAKHIPYMKKLRNIIMEFQAPKLAAKGKKMPHERMTSYVGQVMILKRLLNAAADPAGPAADPTPASDPQPDTTDAWMNQTVQTSDGRTGTVEKISPDGELIVLPTDGSGPFRISPNDAYVVTTPADDPAADPADPNPAIPHNIDDLANILKNEPNNTNTIIAYGKAWDNIDIENISEEDMVRMVNLYADMANFMRVDLDYDSLSDQAKTLWNQVAQTVTDQLKKLVAMYGDVAHDAIDKAEQEQQEYGPDEDEPADPTPEKPKWLPPEAVWNDDEQSWEAPASAEVEAAPETESAIPLEMRNDFDAAKSKVMDAIQAMPKATTISELHAISDAATEALQGLWNQYTRAGEDPNVKEAIDALWDPFENKYMEIRDKLDLVDTAARPSTVESVNIDGFSLIEDI